MARKGICTLAGLSQPGGGGGGGGVPAPNPPTPPITPPLTQQTINMGLASNAPVIFPLGISQIGGGPITRTIPLPLVVNTSLALGPSVSIAGSFTESFAGTNGADWDATKWQNKRTTTNAIADLQAGTGRLSSGTNNNYNGVAGYMTKSAYANFEMSGSFKVQGTTTYVFPHIGFRSSGSWASVHGSALDSYWLEFNSGAPGLFLFKRVGDTPTLIASTTAFTWTIADTVFFTINVSGTTINLRAWKNAETQPTGWHMQIIDATFASGLMYLSLTGGGDALADEIRWGPLTIQGSTVTGPPIITPPPVTGTSLVKTGATWAGYRPAPSMDATISVLSTQAQHIIGFGAEGPLELNPSPGVYNWNMLDPYVQDIIDAGATKPIIILCRAPGWMKGVGGVTQDDLPPSPAFRSQWATLCAAVVARYTNVQYFSYWNEMKGYWNAAANEWDYARYTADYNAVWDACKAVRPNIKLGGPYVILQSGATGVSWSHGPTSVTFPGGSHDQRQMNVMLYFKANARGFDFLSCDGGIENQFPRDANGITPDAYQIPGGRAQLEKLWGWWKWVRANIHPTCELINFETYVNQTGPILGYSEAQKEDLWIELCQKTQDNVPNPNVSYLSWFTPGFRPQVVNRGANDFEWANTPSGFGPKVRAFEGAPPPVIVPPPTGGAVWNVPAEGTIQSVAAAAAPGDTIYLSGTIDCPGKGLFLANKRNGDLGQNPISIIGNPGNLVRCQESGFEGFGSMRGWWFFNINVQVNAASYYGEGFYFPGYRTDQGGDGQGNTNIRVIGCTVRPIPGTGPCVQRGGVTIWGCGGATEIANCDVDSCGWNDNGFFGGAGSAYSCGQSQAIAGAAMLPNGAQLWIHGNKARNVFGPGTPSADRNACILDGWHGWINTAQGNALNPNRVHGTCIIEANDFANCEGRGIQLLCAGADDSQIIIRNNLVRPYMATNLGGSAPETGIGGYGAGCAGNILVQNNDVQVSGGRPAYQFISFNAFGGVTGSGNIGGPVSFDGSPGNSPPPGF